VPKREYALRDVNLSFGHLAGSSSSPSPSPSPSPSSMPSPSRIDTTCDDDDDDGGVVLLVGRSASGKSSLLRMLAGTERPLVGGRVVVVGGGVTTTPIPVVLDRRPDFDDSLTVADRIVRAGLDAVRARGYIDGHGGRNRRITEGTKEVGVFGASFPSRMGAHDGATPPARDDPTPLLLLLLRTLAEDVSSLLTLTDEQLRSPPSGLRPSGQYLLGLACACMASSAPCVARDPDGARAHGARYPIILMDELFDAEHPSIAENCGVGILNVVRAGGVVISATHRPGHFRGMASRTITLSGGRVLTDERMRLPVR